ncbi:MAG: YihA family ribosome biogenesis GTP-binding protein [Bacteroidetes bacterium]|nr:YihA family ribosome biogenesis GTP-binding protein [Bacteroidota bacterium]
MIIKYAEYTASYVDVKKCPEAKLPEFSFIGRSNVGKSSLINSLCGRKALSKVSKTPGKTQTINFFDINHRFNLVDLPGYGFAKKSKTQRDQWDNMIRNYILHREQLRYVALLIDARIPPQQSDLDFCNWMGKNNVPFIILFTKSDKPGSREVITNTQNFNNRLLENWTALPPSFITSAVSNYGRESVLDFIHQAVEEYYQGGDRLSL